MKKIFTVLAALMFGLATLAQPIGAIAQTAATTHLTKSGAKDKRFKENKAPKGPTKKDGSLDMRFKANKKAAAKQKKS